MRGGCTYVTPDRRTPWERGEGGSPENDGGDLLSLDVGKFLRETKEVRGQGLGLERVACKN